MGQAMLAEIKRDKLLVIYLILIISKKEILNFGKMILMELHAFFLIL